MIEPCLCAQITVATPSASKFNGRQPDLVESQGNLEQTFEIRGKLIGEHLVWR
jgi:hypothetical protein